jgi:membrane protein DedA with SNARE-associated domain
MLDPIFDQLLSLIREHGPLLLFVAALLENAAFLSWLVPGEKLVAVGGYFVQQGELRFESAWLCVFLGVLLGDHVGFLIGRCAGDRVLQRIPCRQAVARVERLILRYGGWVVLLGRFTGALRPFVMFTVGVTGLPYRRFWLFELIGAAAWSLIWLGVGVLGGSIIEYLNGFGPWVAWATIGSSVVLGMLAWHYRDRIKQLILGDDDPAGRAPQPAGTPP